MKDNRKKYVPYAVSIGIALAVGGSSALLTNEKMQEYQQLIQPPLAPPSYVFPIVWTILFILMGISAAIVWKVGKPKRSDPLFIYGVQLVVNSLWTIFYFYFNARLLAFFWLLFLLALLILMLVKFREIAPKAAKLQIPYLLWTIFAGYLNLTTFLMNR